MYIILGGCAGSWRRSLYVPMLLRRLLRVGGIRFRVRIRGLSIRYRGGERIETNRATLYWSPYPLHKAQRKPSKHLKQSFLNPIIRTSKSSKFYLFTLTKKHISIPNTIPFRISYHGRTRRTMQRVLNSVCMPKNELICNIVISIQSLSFAQKQSEYP